MKTLFPYQSAAIQAIFGYFYSGGKGNPLVVAPTGSGKSVIISGFCQEVVKKWPTQKILVLSHTEEILRQDYVAISEQLPCTKIGLYSAGLRRKNIKKITVGGVQSVYNKPDLFKQFDIIIVDEAHSISHANNSMYRKFLSALGKKVIGFTATPYRLGKGFLHKGSDAFFDSIVYDISIKDLQSVGRLCPITSKGTKKRLDANKIRKQGGDFVLSDLSKEFDRAEITKDIVSELELYKHTRKKWLLFAIDIDHAIHTANRLNGIGINTACIHSKVEGNKSNIISEFKVGKYQALVSVAMLTTGFDVPAIDLIGLLRPTASPVLHVQIIGRGLRISPETGKKDCLVLDFAGNLMRNGPIDNPIIKVKGDGTGESIMKECDNCYEIVHAVIKICPECGAEFQFKHKLSTGGRSAPVLSTEDWHRVNQISYSEHIGKRGIPMLRVSYQCGLRWFVEFICLEHPSRARYIAEHWWGRRSGVCAPKTVKAALPLAERLKKPSHILVSESGKYPQIKEQKFG